MKKLPFFDFWTKRSDLLITQIDKEWLENGLLLLAEMFGEGCLRSLPTVTGDKQYFDCRFTGTEADAEYIFGRMITLMDIDPWELQLMFYSQRPTQVAPGIVETTSPGLKDDWKGASGRYAEHGPGQKVIWIELESLNDPAGLISTMAHELSHYKLLGENRMDNNDEHLTDLTAIVFGFGIFTANSCFKFYQWQTNRRQGWRMQKKGYLPEQMIAYAMAWLAHYRQEDINWKQHLNKTMKKYFEKSYRYINEHKDSVRWG